MSVFTSITESELRNLLSTYDLGELSGFTGIEAGTDNSNYFVSTTQGEFVLTIFENLSSGELPFFLELGDHLSTHNCRIAEPKHDRSGTSMQFLHNKPAVLFERLQGRHPPVTSLDHCTQMGRAMAEFHKAVSSFEGQRPNPFGLNWLEQHRSYSDWKSPGDGQLFLDTLEELQQLKQADLPAGVIHADLFHDNALFLNDQLSGVIDWYFACNDWLLLDLAIMINDWCRDGLTFSEAKTNALLHAYNARRPLTADENRLLPVMRKAAACRWWLARTLAWNALKDRRNEKITVKSPDEMKAILLAIK